MTSAVVNEALRVLNLISDIDKVMTEDGVDHITRKQIEMLGTLADGHIPDAKETVQTFLGIIDEVKLTYPISHDQIQAIGGLVIRTMKEAEIEDKLEIKRSVS